MTKERELLRRALESLDGDFPGVISRLKDDIRAFLAAETEAEPVSEEIGKALIEMHTNYVATPKVVYQIELNEKAMNADLVAALRFSISKYFDDAYVYGDELLAEVLEDIKNHSPRPEPARKPMTKEEIARGFYSGRWLYEDFEAGIRFAEKHHGIGGGDE